MLNKFEIEKIRNRNRVDSFGMVSKPSRILSESRQLQMEILKSSSTYDEYLNRCSKEGIDKQYILSKEMYNNAKYAMEKPSEEFKRKIAGVLNQHRDSHLRTNENNYDKSLYILNEITDHGEYSRISDSSTYKEYKELCSKSRVQPSLFSKKEYEEFKERSRKNEIKRKREDKKRAEEAEIHLENYRKTVQYNKKKKAYDTSNTYEEYKATCEKSGIKCSLSRREFDYSKRIHAKITNEELDPLPQDNPNSGVTDASDDEFDKNIDYPEPEEKDSDDLNDLLFSAVTYYIDSDEFKKKWKDKVETVSKKVEKFLDDKITDKEL